MREEKKTIKQPKSKFKIRNKNPRWHIRYGNIENYQGVMAFAINELQNALQSFLPEVLNVSASEPNETIADAAQNQHLFILGTPENNLYIKEALRLTGQTLPSHQEGYVISLIPAPWNNQCYLILIAGNTDKGVLYGVEDFNTTVLGAQTLFDDPIELRLRDSAFPIFSKSETPKIEKRGIWSWGYTIYDYRSFFDNMARLRMNTITIWNDCPPVNIDAVINYAHERGIEVILGFPWGWGMTLDLSISKDQELLKKSVLADYAENYADLNHDGIYFQTLTETNEQMLGEQPRAKVACEIVNNIAGELFSLHPDLKIQFGLHATSIGEHYPLLEALDKRVTIAWEDAGILPYSYNVSIIGDSPEDTIGSNYLNSIEDTIDYSKKIAGIRKGSPFAMVAKGFSKLRWGSEFENHGSFILGERSQHFMQKRLSQTESSWGKKNIEWATHYKDAAKFYQEILSINPEDANVTALVEDGLFELKIQPCVALFAQLLWNPKSDHKTIMQNMHNSYLSGNL